MISLTNTDNVNRPELFDSGEFSTVVIDGTTYLFVTTEGNTFSQFVVGADGRATHVRTVVDDSTLELAGGWASATAVVGGTTYLFVTGFDDDGLSVFSIGAGGTLTNVENVTDTATLRLDGPTSLATAVVAGTTYLFAAATEGVSVFSVDASGHLTNVFNHSDDATLERPSSVQTAVVGGTTYLFVINQDPSSLLGGGVSVFSVAANGALTNVDNVADDATLQIRTPFGSTTAVVGGTTYLFVPGADDGGLSVFAVGVDGQLTNVENVHDDATMALEFPFDVTTAVIDGDTYLFAAAGGGTSSSGFSAFLVDEAGQLTNVANIRDDEILNLEITRALATAEVGGTSLLFAAGNFEDGFSVFAIEPLQPMITSNGGGDTATIALAENIAAVTTVTATGTTSPPYSIVGGADAAAFDINSTTGALAFLAAPDFEAPTDAGADNSYEVTVRASAGTLFDDQTITVNVTDLPNGPPVITSNGGGDTASVAVAENTTAVTTVVATQTDGPLLAYAITGGADAARFAIDPASGALSFIDPPDVEAPSDVGGDNGYEVTVRASVGALFDEQALTVDVTGIPDGRPIIPAHLGDVLWQHDDNMLSTFSANIGALPAGSSLSGIGDFDGDGDSDILIRNADMTAEIWELDGSNHVATHDLPVVSDWWSIPGVGDFDRDGDSDILLRHREGLTVVWEIEDNAYVVNHNQPHVSDSWRWVAGDFQGDGDTDMPWQWNWWRVVGTGDFDRDGDSDILWRHSDDGATVMWEMEDGAYVVNHNLPRLTDAWEVAGTGDFDGDGDDDVVWRGDGDQVAAWDIENWAMTSHDLPDVPAVWQIEGTRDFDGDGDSDILWRHQEGAVATWDMQAGALAGTDDFGVVSTTWQIRGTGEFDLA